MTASVQEQRLPLSSGVTLNVATAGPEGAPAAVLLHGFPESHRTWRDVSERLKDRIRLVMPDLRGFGRSDQPQDVADYRIDKLLADLFALADALKIDRFGLVGHDWGGTVAWAAAMSGHPRVGRLAIVNSPHPYLFQRSLIDSAEQRAASQYIRAFRSPGMERSIEAMGYGTFFDKSFAAHADLSRIPAEERQVYLDDWSRPGAMNAMLNWYRASSMIVPAIDEQVTMPEWVMRPIPKIHVPVRIIWGLEDKALLPVQLHGIGEVGDQVEVFPLNGVGHFAPWEAPDAVADALGPFLADAPTATGAPS